MDYRPKLVNLKKETPIIVSKSEAGDYVIESVDHEVIRSIGLTPDQVINVSLEELYRPKEYEKRRAILDQVWGGLTVSSETKLTPELTFKVFLTKSENKIVGFISNISNEKELSRKLIGSETNIRSLGDHIPAVIFQIEINNGQYSVIHISNKIQEYFGVAKDEVFDLFSDLPEAEKTRIENSFKLSLNSKQDWVEQGHIKDQQNNKIWWKVRASIFKKKDNNYLVHGVLENITSEVDQVLVLKEHKLFLDNLTKVAPIGIMVINLDKDIIEFTNDEILATLGLCTEELAGKHLDHLIKLIHPKNKKEFISKVNGLDALKSTTNSNDSSSAQIELEIKNKSGDWIFIRAEIGVLVHQTEVDDRQFIILAKDITLEKMAEKNLNQQKLIMLQTSRMAEIGSIAGCIAHEVNTPLTIISHLIDEIKEESKNSQVKEMSSTANRMIGRIDSIIKGLLNLSKDASLEQVEETKFGRILDQTLLLCENRFTNRRIEIKKDHNPNLIIRGRAVQISQVLLNLLNNSFDAIQELDERWVKIQTYLGEEHLFISLADSGKNIASKVNVGENIYKDFFTTKSSGTGLGLSICKSIIESHHGCIYNDMETENTTFIIKLPL